MQDQGSRFNRSGSVGAIIVAAGFSRRMDGVDKRFAPLMGRPLIVHTLTTFDRCEAVDSFVVVASEANVSRMSELVRSQRLQNVVAVCLGGARRRDSVRAGLKHLPHSDWTVIHDGARPLADCAMVENGLQHAAETGAAAAAVPVADTIKRATAEGLVEGTLEREGLWVVQTPQVFRTDLLKEAHEADSDDATDDASMVERNGGAVRLFEGDTANIKVTTPTDLAVAEALLKARAARTILR